MSTFSKPILAALMGAAILSSCSRPVAYFQRTPTERFSSPKTETVAVATPAEVAEPTPVVAPEVTPTPAEQIAQTKEVMSQVEAYVRNDSKLASNKKLTKRIARVNEMLATSSEKATVSTNAASSKKMSLMERTMLKKLDKKIKNHVAPDEAQLNRNTRNGIIIGAIGLILSLIFGGVIGVIGLILLVVGIVLILLGILE
ncbi:hypothetical protein HNV11_03960 [Spirosoma taeanense]|uniref:Uncharacterized protein n=1 Tax=Spirosoma taeanense TaxID=2735870 RepID=A0A6M5Y462_9BACT|nr:hypothetical protein [Spirosoma taeanense]QJW88589.1 hypothetical protein HNV11_03960 [Spirosoma taeanense]